MISATYVAHMGDDLMVVNAARVSFAKVSKVFSAADTKLIAYLAAHQHWTPFAHPQITLHMKAPIFVARQAFKHKVGFVENEVSRRYVDDVPEFYLPDVWRGRPVNAKQGSAGVVEAVVWRDRVTGEHWTSDPGAAVTALFDGAQAIYEDLILGGVAPEQARMVLPQAMFTEWFWTASLAAWARFANLRLDPHAQAETGELAASAAAIIEPLFPVSWEALKSKAPA